MGVVEVRVPSSKNYVRNYKQEYASEDEGRRADRAQRNKARRMAEAYYGADAIRGKDVDHRRELGMGGSNEISNLQPADPSQNRSYPRTKSGKMKRGK